MAGLNTTFMEELGDLVDRVSLAHNRLTDFRELQASLVGEHLEDVEDTRVFSRFLTVDHAQGELLLELERCIESMQSLHSRSA